MKKILCVGFCLLSTMILFAQSGTLDSSFGQNGKVITKSFNAIIYCTLVQDDGKIVIGGSGSNGIRYGFVLIRYDQDGSLDKTFGEDGIAINDIGDPLSTKIIYSIALQKDNKIVAAGQYAASGDDSRIAVMRFNGDGTIDKAFGDNGLTLTAISNYYDIVRDMTLLGDERIVVTGDTQSGINDNNHSFITCYNQHGQLDFQFGNKGIVSFQLGDVADITAIVKTSKDQIVIGGYYRASLHKNLLLRYDNEGNLDTLFGKKGLAELGFDENIYYIKLSDIAVGQDNKIYTTGYAQIHDFKYDCLLVSAFKENGIPDSSFGLNAYTVTKHTSPIYGNAIAIQKNSKTVTSGYILSGNQGSFMVARYDASGNLDTNFGVNGLQITSFEGSAISNSVAIQKDGNIVSAGYILSAAYQPTLARYKGDSLLSDNPKYVRIKHWLHHHGITWEDKPNNLINYYSIQSSTNGNAFTEVARIYSNHNGGIQTYSAANNATANYRVAAVSNTGNITYSNTLSLVNTTSIIQLYPNPAKNNLQIQGLPAGTAKLTVTDITGNTRIIASAYSTVYSINIAQLTSGNYLLNIKTANEVITKQFIKE